MRYVAHKMVGEPYREPDRFGRSQSSDGPRPRSATASAEPSRPSRVVRAGPRPDVYTPHGRRLLAGLERAASRAEDPQRRIAALRSMARMFGADAGAALARAAANPAQSDSVREAAQRYLKEAEAKEARSATRWNLR